MKLALVTEVLGHEVRSVLGSPFLIFAKSISGNSGPRFTFLRKYMPDKATTWSPSTLLRSKDKVNVQYSDDVEKVLSAAVKEWAAGAKSLQLPTHHKGRQDVKATPGQGKIASL